MLERFHRHRLRRYSAAVAISLLAAGSVLTLAAPGAAAVDAPAVSVTPSSGLEAAGATVTVTGSGFSTAGPGIYLGVAATARFSATNAGAFGAVKWVHLGATPSDSEAALTAEGTLSTTLAISATFGAGANATDCRIEACAIYTLAAHGSADRSQDTSTPISFAPTPSITVSPSTDVADGAALTVTGSGFIAGKGIYVAQTVAKPAGGPPSNTNLPEAAWISAVGTDGTFSTTVAAALTFTGSSAVDCAVTQCFIATFNDHTDMANRSQDVWAPIEFADIVTPVPPVDPIPNDDPAVTVSPSTGVDPAGATQTVTGTGFAATEPGIYVGIASVAKYSPTSIDVFGPTKYVHLGATPSPGQDVLDPDGTFAITLDVAATFGTGANATDCRTEQCAIFTFAAHGSSDRSQDTSTPIAFTGAVTDPTPTPKPSTTSPSPAPTATVKFTSLAPGSAQKVTASGFTAGELVVATLHSEPMDLGTFRASSTGSVTITFTLPADIEIGAHSVELVGLTSGGRVLARFTVSSAPATAIVEATETLTGSDTTLASTGASPMPLATIGLLTIAAGLALMLVSVGRRRVPAARGGRRG